MHWEGKITSVQPRIRLLRSFDERSHVYLGYVLRVEGIVGSESREFTVAVGKAAHEKHQFQVGQRVDGECHPVEDPRKETAEFYKVSKLQVFHQAAIAENRPPPWLGIPPDLQAYRERGHRRLASITYDTFCATCIWGCRMPVEMIVDQWNPSDKQYQYETFCYGPKSCSFYKAGSRRKVPGRRGMTYEEPDWVDEQETSHRGADD